MKLLIVCFLIYLFIKVARIPAQDRYKKELNNAHKYEWDKRQDLNLKTRLKQFFNFKKK